MKGPDGRGLRTKEETMSRTIADLQRLTDRELALDRPTRRLSDGYESDGV